jgi:uncharacterized membrane protein
MEDNVRFCPSCGAGVGNAQAADQPVASTPGTTVAVKSCRCNNCGASLNIPKNTKNMTCPSCNTECVLDGIIRYSEIAVKEGIESGVPLTADAVTLHRQLVSVISKSPNIPLDVFENIEVIKEERYCVPAYCFEYNAEAPYSFEEGRQETRQERGFDGENETITTIKEIKWHTERGTASISGTLFISGNKKMVPYINDMYINTSHNQLVDFNSMEFPTNVETLEYDLPQLAAFNENIKPIVDKLLAEEGKKALEGKSYEEYIPRGGQYGVSYAKNFKLSGSKIQKEVSKIFLGLYHIVYKYKDQEYSIWVSGDGESVVKEGSPENLYSAERKQLNDTLAEKKKIFSSVPGNKTGLLIFGIIVCAGALGFSAFSIISNGFAILFLIIGLVSVAGILLFIKLFSSVRKKDKERNSQRADAQSEIDKAQKAINDFEAQFPNAIRQFREQKKAFRGIYEKVSNDEKAF